METMYMILCSLSFFVILLFGLLTGLYYEVETCNCDKCVVDSYNGRP